MAFAPIRSAVVPLRGQQIPDLSGTSPDGRVVRTRDYYMRRSLGIVFTGSGPMAGERAVEAAEIRAAAHDEAGEILLIVPRGVESRNLPAIVDDGSQAARFGLEPAKLPAIFVVDRYGVVFAASHGEQAVDDLRPRDIPGWLEFIACRCS